MDLSRYKELKNKGSARLQRLGPNFFQIVSRQFDPHSGKELTPEVINCNMQGLDQALKQAQDGLTVHQNAVDSINMLRTDMTAADAAAEANPPPLPTPPVP